MRNIIKLVCASLFLTVFAPELVSAQKLGMWNGLDEWVNPTFTAGINEERAVAANADFAYAIPLDIPKARGANVPPFQMKYMHGAYGLAENWIHGLPCIYLDPDAGGTSYLDPTSPQVFVVGPLGVGRSLIEVNAPASVGGTEYRERIDSHVRYRRDLSSDTWAALSLDNVVSTYSRIPDGSGGNLDYWCLESIVDQKIGASTEIEWEQHLGVPWPLEIKYLKVGTVFGATIRFNWTDLPYLTPKSYWGGFLAYPKSRLVHSVDVLDSSSAVRRRVVFQYQTQGRPSFPSSAVLSAGTQTTRFDFEYQIVQAPLGKAVEFDRPLWPLSQNVTTQSGFEFGHTWGVRSERYKAMDVDADGLVDIVDGAEASGENGCVAGVGKYYSGIGTPPFFDPAPKLLAMGTRGVCGLEKWNYDERWSNALLIEGLSEARVIVIDWDGDSLPDRVTQLSGDEFLVERTLPPSSGIPRLFHEALREIVWVEGHRLTPAG